MLTARRKAMSELYVGSTEADHALKPNVPQLDAFLRSP